MIGFQTRRTGATAAAALLLLAATPGGDTHPLPPPSDPAWEVLELPGVERPTRYSPVAENGASVIVAEARCGASALAVAVPDVDLMTTPVLSWRWWAEQLPESLDERTREGDDFAVRVSVMFAFEPERAGFLGWMRHELIGRVAGREMPGSALHFVWTLNVAPGTVWDNPRTERAKNWALERGPAAGWREAAIDVERAYRKAFGRSPPPLLAVGVMTDSDDHCGTVRGRYADFRFAPRGADPVDVSGIEAGTATEE